MGCVPCVTTKVCAICKQELDLSEFYRKAKGSEVRRNICKSCHAASTRTSSYQSRHGMTQEQVAQIAEDQDGCAICHTHEPGARGWHLDHDHLCQNCTKRRGSCDSCRRSVLCSRCNTAIGLLGDSVDVAESAVAYLKRWKTGKLSEAS